MHRRAVIFGGVSVVAFLALLSTVALLALLLTKGEHIGVFLRADDGRPVIQPSMYSRSTGDLVESNWQRFAVESDVIWLPPGFNQTEPVLDHPKGQWFDNGATKLHVIASYRSTPLASVAPPSRNRAQIIADIYRASAADVSWSMNREELRYLNWCLAQKPIVCSPRVQRVTLIEGESWMAVLLLGEATGNLTWYTNNGGWEGGITFYNNSGSLLDQEWVIPLGRNIEPRGATPDDA